MKIIYLLLLISSINFASQSPEQEIASIGQQTLAEIERYRCYDCGNIHSKEWWDAVAQDYALQARHAVEENRIRFDKEIKLTEEKKSAEEK